MLLSRSPGERVAEGRARGGAGRGHPLTPTHTPQDRATTGPQLAERCAEGGVAHAEITTIGPPDEMIEREAQVCDLILLPRRSHFCFTAREDVGDEPLLKKILKRTRRPVVLVPETPCPEGPAVI